ncbi:hypothetical protein OGAPHI_000482 [Ogataea philodendri]|uniref:YCII-related domain-containing protein n=1 Tax=Ogataea philodendri TaxID=1378263 RepID=A0A9P8PH24_9ASCO|nr:uncharacterized protein OGAPHI_000482 [Ogataea philodendri]KAH3671259.1 hypothetical protein OGAPHI_000482 [Ogataea philodendri]
MEGEHLANIPNGFANGVTNCGAIFTDETKTKFAGSSYNIVANSRDEVIEFLKSDPYYKAGIWSLDDVLIYPYGCAGRTAKDIIKP